MRASRGASLLLAAAFAAVAASGRAAEARRVRFGEGHGERFPVGSEDALGLTRPGTEEERGAR